MGRDYLAETLEYKGFTIEVYQDTDVEEPDYGEDEIFISAESTGTYDSYRIGRKGHESYGERYIHWGEGKWGIHGSDIPDDSWDGVEGESQEAYDLYQEWLSVHENDYVVYPIRCGNAHGPGTFEIREVDPDDYDRIEGYVYIRVPVGDLERLADTRDLEKMKDGIIEMYEQWARGEVYFYVVKNSDGEEIEDVSCHGIYGSNVALEEAKAEVDCLEKQPKESVTLIVIRRDFKWEYKTVQVPLYVGKDYLLEWCRENLGLAEDEEVQQYVVSPNQMQLFQDNA